MKISISRFGTLQWQDGYIKYITLHQGKKERRKGGNILRQFSLSIVN